MDVLSDLLHRARARNAVVRQLIRRPPWSLTYADAPPLAAEVGREGAGPGACKPRRAHETEGGGGCGR
ncbi:cupin domain-containing protein, partial [Amycolatopsis sp. NPDC059027]|uniref:cupin domain-containing protein n=1 Tax=Amycolatopsis sp. NPDC059027 TaxID=3346709 RepID=UPI00366FB4C6